MCSECIALRAPLSLPTRNIWRLRSCIIVFPFLLRQHGARKEWLEAEEDLPKYSKACIRLNFGKRRSSNFPLPFPPYFSKSSVRENNKPRRKKNRKGEKVSFANIFHPTNNFFNPSPIQTTGWWIRKDTLNTWANFKASSLT